MRFCPATLFLYLHVSCMRKTNWPPSRSHPRNPSLFCQSLFSSYHFSIDLAPFIASACVHIDRKGILESLFLSAHPGITFIPPFLHKPLFAYLLLRAYVHTGEPRA